MRPVRQHRTLALVLLVLAPVATFGFWHDSVFDVVPMTLCAVRDEPWLSTPRPATDGAVSESPNLSPPLSCRDPFLTSAEWRSIVPVAKRTLAPTRSTTASWPELQAVISIDGRRTVLLGESPVHPGEKTDDVEVVEINGRDVLVRRQEGSQWLRFQDP